MNLLLVSFSSSLDRMWKSVHACQPSLSQPPFLSAEEGGTEGGPGESSVCGQQGCGRVAGKVSEHIDLHYIAGLNSYGLFCIRNQSNLWYNLYSIRQLHHISQNSRLSLQVLANPWAARPNHHQDEAAGQSKRRGPGAAGSHGVPPVRWGGGGRRGREGQPGRRCCKATSAGATGASPRRSGTYRAGQQPVSLNTRPRCDPGHPLALPSSYLQSQTAFLPYVLSLEIAHNLRSLTSLVYSIKLWNQT